MPTGLSVVGKTYDDVTVFRIAAAHEELMPWLDIPAAGRRPCLTTVGLAEPGLMAGPPPFAGPRRR